MCIEFVQCANGDALDHGTQPLKATPGRAIEHRTLRELFKRTVSMWFHCGSSVINESSGPFLYGGDGVYDTCDEVHCVGN